MGHYDEQYEEDARQRRADMVSRQSSCNHELRVHAVNEYAEPVKLACQRCGLITDVKKRQQQPITIEITGND